MQLPFQFPRIPAKTHCTRLLVFNNLQPLSTGRKIFPVRRQHFAAVKFILHLSIFYKVIGPSGDNTNITLATEPTMTQTDCPAALANACQNRGV